jgi:uncharacterized cupredoxin-like copper-binding protein
MKKMLSFVFLSALPGLAFGSGDHAHGHGKEAHQPLHRHGEHEGSHSTAGKPGDPTQISRTIEVIMDDSMQYTPNNINVKVGETIRFAVNNIGKLDHEMVIGSMDELMEHAEMMRKMPNMQHVEANMITLAPGQQGTLVWQFNQAGTVDFACLVPGHTEAGMIGKIAIDK